VIGASETTPPVAETAGDDDAFDFSIDAMTAVPASATYRTQRDLDREMSREARETGINWHTLRAGSR
jgi:hypothetical protein